MKLTVVENGAQSVHRFAMTEVLIGRSIENDLRLTSGLVSRRHCKVSFEGGALWIEDMGSANGTTVAGERITRTRIADREEFLETGKRKNPKLIDKSMEAGF